MNTFILAITGPGGVGKSTVAKELSKKLDQCANIEVDHVKHFVIKPFLYNESNEGIKQWQLLGENIGLIASNYYSKGYSLVINGFLTDEAWTSLFEYVIPTHKVLLWPGIDKANERDVQREPDYQLGSDHISRHFAYQSSSPVLKEFTKIDSSHHSINDTVSEIKRVLNN